jgi:AraC family transcriptional regulator
MNGLGPWNDAIQYLEERLTDEIDMKEAAKRARCSEYHFMRMFSLLSGTTLAEYIRRRRLTLAAQELSAGATRIIDVAVKYGYQSPDAFTRAFQQLHGLNPSDVRAGSPTLKAFPRMSFQLTIQGGDAMQYRLVEKEAFRIAGLHKRVPIVFNGVNPEIAEMWKQLTPELIGTIKGLSNMEPRGIISASVNFDEGRMQERGELDHYIGAATKEPVTGELAVLEVGPSHWAVFESVGPFPETLQKIWGRIYSEWFPSSDYEIAPGPELLWNEGKDTSSETYRSEIWIPVKKKQQDRQFPSD